MHVAKANDTCIFLKVSFIPNVYVCSSFLRTSPPSLELSTPLSPHLHSRFSFSVARAWPTCILTALTMPQLVSSPLHASFFYCMCKHVVNWLPGCPAFSLFRCNRKSSKCLSATQKQRPEDLLIHRRPETIRSRLYISAWYVRRLKPVDDLLLHA